MITDESTSSDGDVISWSFKRMNIGTVVGTRTWGGTVGIAHSLELIDGTTVTVPSDAFYANDIGWALENQGSSPDIVIANTPNDYLKKVDAQLMGAIDCILPAVEAAMRAREAVDLTPPLATSRGVTPFPLGKL